MLVLLVILLLIAIVFGLGTALEVAFWTLLVVAAVVVLLGFAVRSAMRRF